MNSETPVVLFWVSCIFFLTRVSFPVPDPALGGNRLRPSAMRLCEGDDVHLGFLFRFRIRLVGCMEQTAVDGLSVASADMMHGGGGSDSFPDRHMSCVCRSDY